MYGEMVLLLYLMQLELSVFINCGYIEDGVCFDLKNRKEFSKMGKVF